MSWALIPLTEEQREIQRTARDFAKAEIAPHSDAWDRAEKYDEAIVGKLGQLGLPLVIHCFEAQETEEMSQRGERGLT